MISCSLNSKYLRGQLIIRIMNTDHLGRFKDKASLEAHSTSPVSQALKKGAAEEESLLVAPEMTIIHPIGGFAQRA
jgi:hypothetical protein